MSEANTLCRSNIGALMAGGGDTMMSCSAQASSGSNSSLCVSACLNLLARGTATLGLAGGFDLLRRPGDSAPNSLLRIDELLPPALVRPPPPCCSKAVTARPPLAPFGVPKSLARGVSVESSSESSPVSSVVMEGCRSDEAVDQQNKTSTGRIGCHCECWWRPYH
eukprot:scaffold42491_cov30-Prasinocladus_malaysianus.AAC.2